MDFDDVGSTVNDPPRKVLAISAKDAVNFIDSVWYTPMVARKIRWMDLIGDYAGNEKFVLDGEALLQIVFEDHLLSLGSLENPGFQMLHARHSVEMILHSLLRRDAVFDVVFFHDNRHNTILTGSSEYETTSRSLARRILFQHLRRLSTVGISVHVFQNLSDPNWLSYFGREKPMFMFTNDGGLLDNRDADCLKSERLLLQRTFLFDILTSGLSVAFLSSATFQDLKIMAFVSEQRKQTNARKHFPLAFWKLTEQTRARLDGAEKTHSLHSLVQNSMQQSEPSLDKQLTTLCRRFMQRRQDHLDQTSSISLYVFVTHFIVIETLSVSERAQPPFSLDADFCHQFILSFVPDLFYCLESVASESDWNMDVDLRIFILLLEASFTPSQFAAVVGQDVCRRVDAIWFALDIGGADFTTLQRSAFWNLARVKFHEHPKTRGTLSLMPFDNPILNEQLSVVEVVCTETEDTGSRTARLEFDTIFADTHHWHNAKRAILPKHLGGEDEKVKGAWARSRQLRNQQRFMARLFRHATTLTGALGVPLKTQVIVATKNTVVHPSKNRSDTPKISHHQKGPKKAKALSSKDRLLEKIEAERTAKDISESKSWWTKQLKSLEAINSASERFSRSDDILRSPRMQQPWLSREVCLYRLHLQILCWIEDQNGESQNRTGSPEEARRRDKYSVEIMKAVKDLYKRHSLSTAAIKHLRTITDVLGFPNITPPETTSHSQSMMEEGNDHSKFLFVKLRHKNGDPMYEFMHISEDPIEWQLRLFGDFMDRSVDGRPDPRVQFEPDAWQRKVLDSLDANNSLLVVAPTSAGKTFISYYAMEKVLRESDDGILVYVAPTKALVNQIAAEVYARFRKELKAGSCWAIHTRDYRIHDPQKCQILVTVPEMFAIMLLSPPLARVWTPRIKRIILDEIHSIGQHEGGAVWEQVILLAPCPVIGLSATVGQPQEFNKWLSSVQEARGFKHDFIYHPYRYSHLRKHVYLITKESQDFSGLMSHVPSNRLRFLHPISMLAFGGATLPPDFTLEAADTLSLFNAMVACGSGQPDELRSISPSQFFSNAGFLRQREVISYEERLNQHIQELLASPGSREANSALQKMIEYLQDPELSKVPDEHLNITPSVDDFLRNLTPFLADLYHAGKLPALLFSFDRHACEVMATTVTDALEVAEDKWKEGNLQWKSKLQEWQNWRANEGKRRQADERARKMQKADKDLPFEAASPTWEATFNPSDPLDDFSFADIRKHSKHAMQSDLEDLKWVSVPEWAVRALRRGIGVHHAGMNKAYRSLIESLFRLGYLRVVFATGTLALGINAPAKTAVFVGDSPFLTSLTYRQCAGRAGRRGYDLRGDVVFYGLPMDRIQRLVLSTLPRLSGNFPMTSTLCLRLLNLLHGSQNHDTAVRAVQSILKLPQISFGSETGQHQLLHHVRFSIEYLRRAGLLDASGSPMNLYGVAAFLYHTEPSNLALIALMRKGVLHDICGQDDFVKAKSDLVLLLCHLFGRKYLPPSSSTKTNVKNLREKYPSRVVLPPLQDSARAALAEQNDEILGVFSSYASLYTSQHSTELGVDNNLPLSGAAVTTTVAERPPSPFIMSLRRTALNIVTRSPFVANSGHSDSFATVEELTRTCRRGLNLSEHAIPSFARFVDPPRDGEGSPLHLNAYLFDFFTHGQVQSLVAANGIRRGDVWYALEDFNLSLLSIRGALEQQLLVASRGRGHEETDADAEDDDESPDVDIDDGDESNGLKPAFERPAKVSDGDWRVYEVVDAVTMEFKEKFKKMWA
ncbi:P-loop containing nucleoside triphosphate hydrolase protein [Rickenella mellea]|uniref:P-loop containing nucleoside triphosphate hydrolase protein n=1 Tax=Rickenella mellea TaxID=50990 RepID=A0A4Y7QCI2_9AGAM|nr:P-loop containing nucleoside triphosphate hydrolase protein [Rickenella mellea]